MRTGLLFGSFNPVHVGHLIIASHMCEYGGLDQVLFVLSPQNPFKEEKLLLPEEQRLLLLESAIRDDPRFAISTIEFSMSRPSYTVNTLRELKKQKPAEEYILIMGTDNLETFHLWKEYEEILENYKLYTYPRPGFEKSKYSDHSSVKIFEAPLLNISATFIRETISNGLSAKYLVPDETLQLIETNNYYRK